MRVEFVNNSLFLKEMVNALYDPLWRCNALIWSLINFHLSLATIEIEWGLNALLINVGLVVFNIILWKLLCIHALTHKIIRLYSRHCSSSLHITLWLYCWNETLIIFLKIFLTLNLLVNYWFICFTYHTVSVILSSENRRGHQLNHIVWIWNLIICLERTSFSKIGIGIWIHE